MHGPSRRICTNLAASHSWLAAGTLLSLSRFQLYNPRSGSTSYLSHTCRVETHPSDDED